MKRFSFTYETISLTYETVARFFQQFISDFELCFSPLFSMQLIGKKQTSKKVTYEFFKVAAQISHLFSLFRNFLSHVCIERVFCTQMRAEGEPNFYFTSCTRRSRVKRVKSRLLRGEAEFKLVENSWKNSTSLVSTRLRLVPTLSVSFFTRFQQVWTRLRLVLPEILIVTLACASYNS